MSVLAGRHGLTRTRRRYGSTCRDEPDSVALGRAEVPAIMRKVVADDVAARVMLVAR